MSEYLSVSILVLVSVPSSMSPYTLNLDIHVDIDVYTVNTTHKADNINNSFLCFPSLSISCSFLAFLSRTRKYLMRWTSMASHLCKGSHYSYNPSSKHGHDKSYLGPVISNVSLSFLLKHKSIICHRRTINSSCG